MELVNFFGTHYARKPVSDYGKANYSAIIQDTDHQKPNSKAYPILKTNYHWTRGATELPPHPKLMCQMGGIIFHKWMGCRAARSNGGLDRVISLVTWFLLGFEETEPSWRRSRILHHFTSIATQFASDLLKDRSAAFCLRTIAKFPVAEGISFVGFWSG